MPLIDPLSPPYDEAADAQLASMMPPGADPILLFRTMAKNLPMAAAMRGWGGYVLSASLSLTLREREILIDRTCARCCCEYEWGVHIAFFAERAGFDGEQVRSLTDGSSGDPCWTDPRDRLLIEAADALHDTSTIAPELGGRLAEVFSEGELLDIFMVCGWYHAISFTANAAGVERESGAPTFGAYSQPGGSTDRTP